MAKVGEIIKTVTNWTWNAMNYTKLPFEDAFKYAIGDGAPKAFEEDRESWLSQFPKTGKDSLRSKVESELKKAGHLGENDNLAVEATQLGNKIISYLRESLNEAEPSYSDITVKIMAQEMDTKQQIIKGALWRLVEQDLVYTYEWDDLKMTTVHLTDNGWKYIPLKNLVSTTHGMEASKPEACCKLNKGEPDMKAIGSHKFTGDFKELNDAEIIELAKGLGVTWKECQHAGINRMRAIMAIKAKY